MLRDPRCAAHHRARAEWRGQERPAQALPRPAAPERGRGPLGGRHPGRDTPPPRHAVPAPGALAPLGRGEPRLSAGAEGRLAHDAPRGGRPHARPLRPRRHGRPPRAAPVGGRTAAARSRPGLVDAARDPVPRRADLGARPLRDADDRGDDRKLLGRGHHPRADHPHSRPGPSGRACGRPLRGASRGRGPSRPADSRDWPPASGAAAPGAGTPSPALPRGRSRRPRGGGPRSARSARGRDAGAGSCPRHSAP